MRDVERRIERLEAMWGELGCTCEGPALFVLAASDPYPAPFDPCPVHAAVNARLVVRLTAPQGAPQEIVQRGSHHHTLANGSVVVDLPGPGDA